MSSEIRVVIVDDHPIFRQGLRQVIEKDPRLKVVAEASNGVEALDQISHTQPDVALLDVDMPEKDGFAVATELHRQNAPVRIVFLTMYKDALHFHEALNLGASGYILKDSAATDVVACLKAVSAGQNYVSPVLSTHLLDLGRRATRSGRERTGLDELTPSEMRVLAQLAEYKTSREIAVELGVSVRTVENHRANICTKLGLHGTHALVKFALQHKAQLP